MTPEPLIKATPDNYAQNQHRSEIWAPVMQVICQRHQLPTDELSQFHDGSNIIFAVGKHHVIKLFEDSSQFVRERPLLEMLGSSLGVTIPQIVAQGDIENWPYLVMTRVNGQRLDSIWYGLDAENQTAIVQDLGRIIARLHQFPTQNMEGLEQEYPRFSNNGIQEIISEEREDGTPEHLLAQIPQLFESVQPLLLSDVSPVIILGDIQPEHLLCQESNGRWQITGFVDFADAMLGRHEYDFFHPVMCLMPFRPELLRAFLLAYGYNESQLTEQLGRRLTAMLIDAGYLGDALEDIFPDTPIQWLEQLQAALFSFSEDRKRSLVSTNPILSQKQLDLGDNLILRFAQPDDVDALIDFNAEMFNERHGQWTRELLSGQHPTVQPGDFTIVEDTNTNKIVSSMFSLPQTWSYDGIPLKVGMPELVATHPDYRRRGLMRKQLEVIHTNGAVRGELMQVISGVQWLYTRFGYAKAINRFGGRIVEPRDIPKPREKETERCRLRPATEADHSFIQELYDLAIRRHLLAVHRISAEWEHTFNGHIEGSSRYRKWAIIEGTDGTRLGYIHYLPKIWDNLFQPQHLELKPGIGYLNLMPSLLRGLLATGQALDTDEEFDAIYFSLGIDHPMYAALPENQVVDVGNDDPRMLYARISNKVAFLKHICPALERHLVGTVAEGYTGRLRLNLFESGIIIGFTDGRITEIHDWSPSAMTIGDAFFPEATFLQLVCGRRRFSELAKEYPDCSGSYEASVLFDCLFPPFTGHVWVMS